MANVPWESIRPAIFAGGAAGVGSIKSTITFPVGPALKLNRPAPTPEHWASALAVERLRGCLARTDDRLIGV